MTDLPEELLAMICSFSQTKELHSLCLTSKTCHRTAYPILYYYLHVPQFGPAAKLILRSLVENPRLALAVKHVELECWDTMNNMHTDHAVLDKEYPKIESYVKFDSVRNLLPYEDTLQHDLFRYLDGGLPDAIITALLAICQSLEYLDLTGGHKLDESLLMTAIDWSSCRWPAIKASQEVGDRTVQEQNLPFFSVRTVCIRHWDTEGFTYLTDISPILRLPALKTFHGFMVGLDDEAPNTFTLPPGSSTISTAIFENSMFDAAGIETLLRACPQMKSLKIEWGSAVVGGDEIRFSEIGDVLRKYGKGLHHLVLEPLDSFFFVNGEEDIHRPLGVLKSLTGLENLNVPEMALFGSDDSDDEGYPNFRRPKVEEVLPDSLESLTITGCTDEAATRDIFIQLSPSITLTLLH